MWLHSGQWDDAREILADFDRAQPGYVLIQLRRIGIDRRQALVKHKCGQWSDRED